MRYFRTRFGTIINEENVTIPMDESSELYVDYFAFLSNNGVVEDTDFVTEEDTEKESLESETEKYIQRTQDGINSYARISAEFRLAKLSGQISEEEHHGIETILIPVRNEVLAGQWKSGLIILENIGSSQIGVNLYNRLHTYISNYIAESY